MTNVAAVVSRHFGGMEPGAGGLAAWPRVCRHRTRSLAARRPSRSARTEQRTRLKYSCNWKCHTCGAGAVRACHTANRGSRCSVSQHRLGLQQRLRSPRAASLGTSEDCSSGAAGRVLLARGAAVVLAAVRRLQAACPWAAVLDIQERQSPCAVRVLSVCM